MIGSDDEGKTLIDKLKTIMSKNSYFLQLLHAYK